MSEIEKMYKNAGIKPTNYDACALEDKYWNNEELANQYGTLDRYLSFECPHYGEGCYSTCEYAYDKDEYPPFTADKQIELIKWLELNDNFDFLEMFYKPIQDLWCFRLYWLTELAGEDAEFTLGHKKTFKEALAMLVNNLWQYLTLEEKQQVKGILE